MVTSFLERAHMFNILKNRIQTNKYLDLIYSNVCGFARLCLFIRMNYYAFKQIDEFIWFCNYLHKKTEMFYLGLIN